MDDDDFPSLKTRSELVTQYGFCGMVRHGERADNVRFEELDVEVECMLDPPLTPLGWRQAEDTGHFLKEFFDKNDYTDIIIESSPFLRTMQTASTVAKILGV